MAEPATFGKYFLTEKIATGGMAEIYLGKLYGPGGFEKQLVIKQIHPELGGDPRFVELLVAEAKTLVSLSHGNIVPIYELGVVDDTYFIAMEYVDGPTLDELSRALDDRGDVLSPAVAAHIVARLLGGLDYAHRKGDGLVHRDLSMRNVMLSREGEVKLLDFGIALPMGAAPRAASGKPAGSYPYMSPEQVRCEVLDPRSDLFSAGVLLWEMLTGEALFARADADATLAAVLEADIVAPSTLRAGIAGDLDAICLRALARDREDRYQSAGELLRDLHRHLYASDALLEPAAIAALVARLCPPVARRVDDDAEDAKQAARPPSRPTDGTTPMQRTRPMAKDRGGPRRDATVRSFATRADLEAVLGPAPVARQGAAARTPGRTRIAAAAVAIAAAVAVLVAVGLPREVDAPLLAEHATLATAPVVGPPAATDEIDAGERVAVEDGAEDAGPAEPAPPPGADVAARRARPEPVARGHGTLRVGANPWGDVYLDDTRLGRAPGSWQISSGRHDLEVRNGDDVRRFAIDVEHGEVESLGVVDFTR